MYGPTTGPPMAGWTFQVPPTWPAPPAGWTPPPGWQPDPSAPPPPLGWQFWVPPGGQVSTPPAGPALPMEATRVAAPAARISSPDIDHFVSPTPPAAPAPAPPTVAAGPSGWVPQPANPYAAPVPAALPPSMVVSGPRHRAGSDPWPTQERPHHQRVWLMIAFIVGMAAVGFVMAAVAGTYLRGHVNPADYATEEAYRAAWEHAALKATTTIRVVQLVSSAILFFILAQRAGFAGRACLLILIPVIGTIVAFRILWRWTDIHHWERTVGRPGKSYFRWDRPNLMRSQQQYV